MKSFEKLAKTVNQRILLSLANIHLSFEDITLLCLQIEELEQLEDKKFFVGAFDNTYYSTLVLGEVKNLLVKKTIYVNLFQKIFLYFIVKRIVFAQNEN